MFRIRSTCHDPRQCGFALAGADVAFIDLETTGVSRHDRIVAAGVLVDRDAHLLVTEQHRDVSSVGRRVGPDALRRALQSLETRRDLIAVFHNAVFDVGMLERAGVAVKCRVHDTMKLLKLYDSDRGREMDDGAGTGTHDPRHERRYDEPLNYRLKDVARHLLDRKPIEFPGSPVTLPLDGLARYLKSDLIVTRDLYRMLTPLLPAEYWDYNDRLISPVTRVLVGMSAVGVRADLAFITSESQRLLNVMQQLSDHHHREYGVRLDAGDFHLRSWVYSHGLRCRKVYSGRTRQLSLRTKDLQDLWQGEGDRRRRRSLSMLHDYKVAQSLMVRLRSLGGHVDRRSSRIHSTFNDFQSSGRVSSTNPNLQQVAGTVGPGGRRTFLSRELQDAAIHSRNALVASPGHELVAFDVAQADIRVLAHAVESLAHTAEEHLDGLQAARRSNLRASIGAYCNRMWSHFQPQNREQLRCDSCWARFLWNQPGPVATCPVCGGPVEAPAATPTFDPSLPCRLAEDFHEGGADFYTAATVRMLGRPPADKSERNHMKQTILGIVNGMSGAGLAKQLDVDVDVARGYLDSFANAYPQVSAYRELTRHAFAVTGESWTFAGHHRRITPHWWMVTLPKVDLFVSYKQADKLWLRVVPLRPNRFTLTCWVLRVIDARYGSPNEGKEIYNHRVGRISQAPYRFFNDRDLIFRLPVRNVSWRLIRRVRTDREEAVYDGYDRTWRQLFNHVAQGGTADVTKTMMLRCQPVVRRFAARLLLQIHDELVFEVPTRSAEAFTRSIRAVLQEPPIDGFRVPIVVEPRTGGRFGELTDVDPAILVESWWLRAWLRTTSWVTRRLQAWARGVRRALARAGVRASLIMVRIWRNGGRR